MASVKETVSTVCQRHVLQKSTMYKQHGLVVS